MDRQHRGWARRVAVVVGVTVTAGALTATPAAALAVDATGLVSGGGSDFQASVSDDGRVVAFVSHARLTGDDTDNLRDVYARDRGSGALELISNGTTAPAERPSVSGDGRFVAYDTATGLVGQDTDGLPDVYRRDRQTGEVLLVSRGRLSSTDTFSNGESIAASISTSGARVAFESTATDLVDGDTNQRRDVFTRDISGQFTFRASVTASLGQANGASREPAISGSGTHVAFTSEASNLVPGDTNGVADVYVRDTRQPGATLWASRPKNAAGGAPSGAPAVSGDGRTVVFQSLADLLTGGGELICAGRFEGDTPDVFAFDTGSSALTVVSGPAEAAGHDADDPATAPSVSTSGSVVSYTSTPVDVVSCPNPHPDPNDPGPRLPELEFGDSLIVLDAGSSAIRPT